jgi:hypothetical protein
MSFGFGSTGQHGFVWVILVLNGVLVLLIDQLILRSGNRFSLSYFFTLSLIGLGLFILQVIIWDTIRHFRVKRKK